MSHLPSCARCPIVTQTDRSSCSTCGIGIIHRRVHKAKARKRAKAIAATFLAATLVGVVEGILAKTYLVPFLIMGAMWYASAFAILGIFILMTRPPREPGHA
jgi:hypothetical protein